MSKAILIANIGNADLTIGVGESAENPCPYLPTYYYLPPVTDNRENSEADLPDKERDDWNNRVPLLVAFADKHLNIKPASDASRNRYPSFRLLTENLLSKYQSDPKKWHQRIGLGRLIGPIKRALELSVANQLNVYLFISNQVDVHDQDTICLGKIIKFWFEQNIMDSLLSNEEKNKVNINLLEIPKKIPIARDTGEDQLLNFYYQEIQKIQKENEDCPTFINIRGGTDYMKTALRVQSITAGFRSSVTLEPQAIPQEIIAGKSSFPKTVSYWRFQQIQRCKSILQLLERWDFSGALVLTEEWQQALKNLEEQVGEEYLNNYLASLEDITKFLRIAIAYFNLDDGLAKTITESLPDKTDEQDGLYKTFCEIAADNNLLLKNLYSQCKILYEFDQIPTFLGRLGSFHEISQKYLIHKLGLEQYFTNFDEMKLSVENLWGTNHQLWKEFCKLYNGINQKEYKITAKFGSPKRTLAEARNHKKFGPLVAGTTLRIQNRYARQFLLEAALNCDQLNHQEIDPANWKKLDFWYDKRNQVIHRGAGLSKSSMLEMYKMKANQGSLVCHPNQILVIMQSILQIFDLTVDHYYPYENIRKLVSQKLELLI
jgi:hypothetical protein